MFCDTIRKVKSRAGVFVKSSCHIGYKEEKDVFHYINKVY